MLFGLSNPEVDIIDPSATLYRIIVPLLGSARYNSFDVESKEILALLASVNIVSLDDIPTVTSSLKTSELSEVTKYNQSLNLSFDMDITLAIIAIVVLVPSQEVKLILYILVEDA
mmetsp:Transcript_640/g.771  ORF Transcript_640/g.771 Transcript_640/m.771 type:complete len:115 (-) Transcript_640:511-855(-)